MSKIKIYFLCIYTLFCAGPLSAMVYDNRFIPLFEKPRIIVDGKQTSFDIDVFMATASKALGQSDTSIGIPELAGKLDLATLGEAIIKTGKPNLLQTEFLGLPLPWDIEGKLQAQCLAFAFHRPITPWFAVGANWFWMRVNSSQEFFISQSNLLIGDRLEIDLDRRAMFSEIGLVQNHSSQIGFGDVDCYLYFGKMWDYSLKFRRINVDGRLGLLIPSGLTREINNPASIPFGGNGHWGVYGQFDGLFELREDLKAGLLMRFSKRFAKRKFERLSVNGEPYIFGATTGNVTINPGYTFVFSPYAYAENLRQGLGLGVQYTVTVHQKDTWKNPDTDPTIPIKLENTEKLSNWGSDYFTLNIFYDFGKEKSVRAFDPIISFRWDIPAMFSPTKNSCKTNRVSVGIEFVF